MLSVVDQFFDGFVHIRQCCVLLLLLEVVENLGFPTLGKFLQRADV
jgi:hypothetical protein